MHHNHKKLEQSRQKFGEISGGHCEIIHFKSNCQSKLIRDSDTLSSNIHF